MPASPDPYLQGGNLLLDDIGLGDPTFLGNERYVNGSWRRRDALGVYDPRTVWRAPHDQALSIAHLLDNWTGGGCYITLTGNPYPTLRQYWVDYQMKTLLGQVAYTRNALGQVTQRVTTVYASDGTTVAAQATDQFTYDGAFCTTIRRT